MSRVFAICKFNTSVMTVEGHDSELVTGDDFASCEMVKFDRSAEVVDRMADGALDYTHQNQYRSLRDS